ncbi:Crp/Fnr family transcriptional regulator [Nitrogeniibacter mangrovi]|uniref:Crp/Fnr family transcriptional regulator n=1 Tax=Nitrogeniibacter mangrovi TaxID=2016596 RepID=A0A6C1B924_9RHOO|nr:Crp/Fnr family transcriptional regulator [Nitrogeniibacter mangrovi]QID19248.1 Crp/Fnr family transcriptional regulator [Nitrogeniibacter mangrovi]
MSHAPEAGADGAVRGAGRVRRTLAGMPLLAGLPASTVELLARDAHFKRFKRGGTIFRRGSAPTGLFFVVEGAVKLLARDPDGREKVIELFTERRFFGELGVFRLSRYRAWTQAVRECVLLHIPSDALIAAVRADPELSLRMLSDISGRIQALIESISQSTPTLAHKRIAAYLMELRESAGEGDDWIRLPAPKYAVASMLNLSGESLSRALRKLREAGVIEEGRGRMIRLVDLPAIERLLDL